MASSKELNKIKKIYGEKFMQYCRETFPTILEQEGRLYEILVTSFSRNCRTLYEDITENKLEDGFKNYIYSRIDIEDPEKKIVEEKTPYQILEEAGYELKECLTEEEIQEYKKYYKKEEELCTFNGGRLNRCVVFFAVKKGVEQIKRENFKKPKREDEYGTSVISVQFEKYGMCTVSIKNRYNHTVNNPDATYGNDLDRIAEGLTESFTKLLRKKYRLELNNNNIEIFEIPGYLIANDGKYYKYNIEMNGIYYCPDNIIIENGAVQKIENPESKLLIEHFVIDTKNKEIRNEALKREKKIGINSWRLSEDSFVDSFCEIEKIEITKIKQEDVSKRIMVYVKGAEEPAVIEINKDNQIVKYKNKNIIEVGNNFLYRNQNLKYLELPNLRKVNDGFMYYNKNLKRLELQKLEIIGNDFLFYNRNLENLELPKLRFVQDDFLHYNQKIVQLKLEKLEIVGDRFLNYNKNLRSLELPQLLVAGKGFLYYNENLRKIYIPHILRIEEQFSELVEKNNKEEYKKISAKDIAVLDKQIGLTKSEIDKVSKEGLDNSRMKDTDDDLER